MPHIRVESTAGLLQPSEIEPLLSRLVDSLSALPTVNRDSIKASYREHSHFAVGAKGRPGFLHVEIAILSGRPPELKRQIADAMLSAVQNALPDLESGYLTQEIREMDADAYRRA